MDTPQLQMLDRTSRYKLATRQTHNCNTEHHKHEGGNMERRKHSAQIDRTAVCRVPRGTPATTICVHIYVYVVCVSVCA
eukprot:10406436-Alexandrium_andersonii.AAC.1